MIQINKVYILDIKAYKSEESSDSYLEFLPNKSMYDGRDKKKKFAVFKYGGKVSGFIVLLSVKVLYSTKYTDVRDKLEEFAYDLVDDIFIENIKKSIESIKLPIFE